MSTPQQANEHNLSRILHCPRCHTQLPLNAAFCSSCGEQVEKIGEWENGDDDTQPQLEVPLRSKVSQSLPATPILSTSEAWQQVPEAEVPAFLSEDSTAPSIPVPGVDTKKQPFSQQVRQRVTRSLSAVSSIPQRKAVSNPSRSDWLWPTIIILSAVAAGLVNFAFTGTALRPIVVFWFLFVCPGMVLVRFLRLNEPIVEWTLALALSFAIDAIVAGILLYAGRWSPSGILSILIGLSLCGAIVQLATSTIFVPKQLHTVRSRKPSEWDLIG
jgi:hypothetical protein